MNSRPTYFAHLIAVAASIIGATPAVAQQQIVPSALIPVSSPVVTINNGPGDQTLPHVSKDLAAYTDQADDRIHYYRFSTGVDAAIPAGDSVNYMLSDVSGNRVCFTRQEPTGAYQIAVFDVQSSSVTDIDPQPGAYRLGCALGGDTLVYVDYGTGTGTGDLFVYDFANPFASPQPLSLSPNQEQNPNVSPDGNTIVWENCASSSNCDVMKATRSGGVWTVSTVVNTAAPEENPDTDGTWIVYDAHVGDIPHFQQIFFRPATGGPETQLVIDGVTLNPSISRGFIGFEATIPPLTTANVFIYDIAANLLYQITNTPSINESLNDVSVLDNGDVRVVWATDDGVAGTQNIYATTFTPIRPTSYQVCPLYDGTVAKKSGSAYPIKVQICDASGNNLSSSSLVLHAVSVTQVSTSAPMTLDDTGNANPDLDFRYDSNLAAYVFNLNTKGYTTGTYSLNFTVGADPTLYSTLFAVK